MLSFCSFHLTAWWECLDWRKLSPEEKVRMAVSMVDVVTQISAENERQKNPAISEGQLILLLRRRFHLPREKALSK
jgi:hypothetical protein